jgi:hypothetical protein
MGHSGRQIGLYFIAHDLGFRGIRQPLHHRHSNSYVGAWSPEDQFVPHPIESIVEVAWLDPYASCLLFCFSFDLPAIKPVNITCLMCNPFLFYFANRWWFIIADNVDQIPSPWRERRELRETQGVV